MLERFSFARKIALLIAGAVLSVIIISGVSVWNTRVELLQSKRDILHAVVQSAQSVVEGFRARASAGSMTEADAKNAAREALRTLRYGGTDGKAAYVYIHDVDGTFVMHPFKPEWEGKPMLGKSRTSTAWTSSARWPRA